MKKIKTMAIVLGLFAAGVAVGQAKDAISEFYNADVSQAQTQANSTYAAWALSRTSGLPAAFVSNQAEDTKVRLAYLQVKQNAEIIRLLTELNTKK
ncbi:hypothetical protein E7T09_13000 [Deinococcus sp. KSM4-11]|uniref:hypothetical protein n=1 Tax=Deinococcus sp. KSM4-11 TaxID=2568654 RepID=UPI0010A5318D|nr:hypothetical protein [Deinococcus sp. KSM4-11]THF86142.1 hypothetical protein E7T09_13000 [Deinococcus sp. KSM4-11]